MNKIDRRRKIFLVFGTRPEAVKMAPLIKELRKWEDLFELGVVVTAQHREMLDQVLKLFEIKTDFDLNLMTPEQSLAKLGERILSGLSPVFAERRPDLVLVHGDTSTTFFGALAAFYQQIQVGHVEAGLRTHNRYSPFPEEMNRNLTGILADYHFAPTTGARDNLLAENISTDKIMVTGNTVIDALLSVAARDDLAVPEEVGRIPDDRKIILVTTHRRENLGASLRQVYEAILMILREHEDVEVVFPVHLNPEVRRLAWEILGASPRVHLLDPLDYAPFVAVMRRAYLVLTDSGGIQEEAPALGKPVLVLRDTTERPEAVTAGTARLIGAGREKVYAEVNRLLIEEAAYREMAEAVNPYGDGKAAERIAGFLRWRYGFCAERPEEFNAYRQR